MMESDDEERWKVNEEDIEVTLFQDSDGDEELDGGVVAAIPATTTPSAPQVPPPPLPLRRHRTTNNRYAAPATSSENDNSLNANCCGFAMEPTATSIQEAKQQNTLHVFFLRSSPAAAKQIRHICPLLVALEPSIASRLTCSCIAPQRTVTSSSELKVLMTPCHQKLTANESTSSIRHEPILGCIWNHQPDEYCFLPYWCLTTRGQWIKTQEFHDIASCIRVVLDSKEVGV